MVNPKFSVIIPTFNRVGLLRQALDSVYSQTFTDHEIIVVDDGSTDGTDLYLLGLRDRVRVFRQANQGPGVARNLGIANAQGEYVAFLDSDDVWCPWTLEIYAEVIAGNREVTFIAGRGAPLEMQEDIMRTSPQRCFELSSNFLTASRRSYAFGGTPGMAVNLKVLRSVGGFVSQFINGEDQDLCLRLGTSPGFVRILSPPLFLQRTNDVHLSENAARSFEGMNLLLERERAGEYPGGLADLKGRHEIICAAVRSISIFSARTGHISNAWILYRDSFWWQLSLRRWKYLMGFPLMTFAAAIKQKIA